MYGMHLESLRQTWPWYVAGPIIGLFVPVLLIAGDKRLGISGNLRHLCAAVLPKRMDFLRYDWWGTGAWNLAFLLGVVLGGWVGVELLGTRDIAIAAETKAALGALGLSDFSGLAPRELISWEALGTWKGLLTLAGGGFLVGFGTAYASGCTSGHAINGLSHFQLRSLFAVIGFFAGGLATTHFLLPYLLPVR